MARKKQHKQKQGGKRSGSKTQKVKSRIQRKVETKLVKAFVKLQVEKQQPCAEQQDFHTEQAQLKERHKYSTPLQKKKKTIKKEMVLRKKQLQFAAPTFSLVKSTDELLQETVAGLGAVQVTQSVVFSSLPTRPPPNTPITATPQEHNRFALLAQEEAPPLVFAPATFHAPVSTCTMGDMMDPDL